MLRCSRWLRPGLAAALATLVVAQAAPAAVKVKKESVGDSPTYKLLGELPTMHEGRIKPIDTVAREEIKSIYTRETIRLTSDDGSTVTTWSPVAAFFDWSARPKFWDAQPIIAVEWLPLKRFILRGEIRTALESIAGKASLPAADRARIQAVMALDEIDSRALRGLIREGSIPEAEARVIDKLAAKVGEETRWLSPDDIEDAEVVSEGKPIPFVQWLDDLSNRGQRAGMMGSGKPKLTDLEQKAFDLGMKLAHYRAIRDRETFGAVPLLVVPHPSGAATLKYAADAYKKAEEQGPRSLAPLELEAANALHKYLNDLPGKDRAMPGESAEFDARFTQWLKEKSAWVPLGVIREVAVEELARAGFPAPRIEAFRAALKGVEDEERAHPGLASIQPALALIDASRDLGRALNSEGYPTVEAMDREVWFNKLAPFFNAPIAYGVALLALIFSLVAANFGASMKLERSFGVVSKLLYLAGIAGFAAGIGLEAYGFYLRIRISGWAPVTNMYETVIWVAMITSILGMVLEAIYRKTYAALAASGVALLATGLAATVPLLDPDIPQLPPVLRNNFWLTIHVLTIVSSYAAFALAMGLGVAATSLYLTATYKRTASLVEVVKPILPGAPLMLLGWFGAVAWSDRLSSPILLERFSLYGMIVLFSVGLVMTGSACFALLGELVNRSLAPRSVNLDEAALAGGAAPIPSDPFAPPRSDLGGGTAVLTAPPVAATSAATARPKPDARTLAMQATAAQIKPISNFIYRSMQVGILLVSAGTFLGGWWADVSWGRFWGWDPKEVWALITLLVYLIPLHGRFAGWVNTFWLVMASVVCFLSVLMAWYGVNFVLGVGLHSYGFTEGGSQGTVGVATLVVLSYAMGAFWRRRVSSALISV